MDERFGKILAELRKERGLTQKQLAEQLFVSNKTISKWETGEITPDIRYLLALSELYGLSLDELLKGTKPLGKKNRPGNLLSIFMISALAFSIVLYFVSFLMSMESFESHIILIILGIGILLMLSNLMMFYIYKLKKRSDPVQPAIFYLSLLNLIAFVLMMCVCFRL